MYFSTLLQLLKINLLARKKVNFIYISLYFLSAVFLILVTLYGAKLFWGFDYYIDNEPEMSSYREFKIQCTEPQLQRFVSLLNGKGSVTKLEDSVYLVQTDQYDTRTTLIKQINKESGVTLILDMQTESNLDILEQGKKALLVCILLAVTGMLAIMNMNIRQAIAERKQEIAIYYSVGYTPGQIIAVFWSEMAALLTIGVVCSYFVCLGVEPFIDQLFTQKVRLFDWAQMDGSIYANILVLFIFILGISFEIHNVRRQLWTQPPLEVFRGAET